MLVISLFLLILGMLICYLLSLSYIGITSKVREIIVPVLIMSVFGYISRAVLHNSNPVHTIMLLFLTIALVKVFHRNTSWLVSAIGSFLTQFTFEFVSLMLPFVDHILGITPKVSQNTWGWILLNLAEFVVPLTVLIILKATKVSLLRYIPESK